MLVFTDVCYFITDNEDMKLLILITSFLISLMTEGFTKLTKNNQVYSLFVLMSYLYVQVTT